MRSVRPGRKLGQQPPLSPIENPTTVAGYRPRTDADADAATGVVQSEFAVAKRFARLLQGSACASGRRHPDGESEVQRQGDGRERNPTHPQRGRRRQRRSILRQQEIAGVQQGRCSRRHDHTPTRPPRATAKARSIARTRYRPTLPAWSPNFCRTATWSSRAGRKYASISKSGS